jgi:bacteriocin biosynthesis cyclodehydratase domain-containing protein
VHRRVTDAAGIAELAGAAAGQAAADVVVCAIDSPDDIHLLVNEACCGLGIPFVAGGLTYSTLSYWSVRPGRTPCRLCLELHREDEREAMPAVLREPPLIEPSPVNRATGPVVQLICGLMALEVMRYLTRTDPPVAAATYQVIELADGLETSRAPWARHPACPLCAAAGRPAPEPGAGAGTLLAAGRAGR